MKSLGTISLWLAIIGALNWGLVGLIDYNVVTSIFGDGTTLTSIVYDIIGLAAIVLIVNELTGDKK